jgi:hypothetical protein
MTPMISRTDAHTTRPYLWPSAWRPPVRLDGSVVGDVIVASPAGIAGTLTRSLTYAITIHLVARSGIAPTV